MPEPEPDPIQFEYAGKVKGPDDTWKADFVEVEGCFLPALDRERFETDQDLQENVILASRCAKRFIGLPISVSHQYAHDPREAHDPEKHIVVGKIVDAWMKPDHSMHARFRIDTGTLKGGFAVSGIKKGLFKGLSLAHRNLINTRTNERVQIPLELSLCKEGKRPDTWITSCTFMASKNGKEKYISQELLDTLYEFDRRCEEESASTIMASASASANGKKEAVPPKETPETEDVPMEEAAPETPTESKKETPAPAATETKTTSTDNIADLNKTELLKKLVEQERERLRLAAQYAQKTKELEEKESRLTVAEEKVKAQEELEKVKFLKDNEVAIEAYAEQYVKNAGVPVTKKNLASLRQAGRDQAVSFLKNKELAWMVQGVQCASKAAALEAENKKLRMKQNFANDFRSLSNQYMDTMRDTVLASKHASQDMDPNADADLDDMQTDEVEDEQNDTSDQEEDQMYETPATMASKRMADQAMTNEEIMAEMRRLRAMQATAGASSKRTRRQKTKVQNASFTKERDLSSIMDDVWERQTPLRLIFSHDKQPHEIINQIHEAENNGTVILASAKCAHKYPDRHENVFDRGSLLRRCHVINRRDLFELPCAKGVQQAFLNQNPDMRIADIRSSNVCASKAWTSDGKQWANYSSSMVEPSEENGIGKVLSLGNWNPELAARVMKTLYEGGASSYSDATNTAAFSLDWQQNNFRTIHDHLARMEKRGMSKIPRQLMTAVH